MAQILSQDEVDALLRGISGGQVETEQEEIHDPSDVVTYDLTSQDRIIRGRMPTLEMTNEKFVRMFRTTLSALMRKVVSVSTLAVDMIKFGEFLQNHSRADESPSLPDGTPAGQRHYRVGIETYLYAGGHPVWRHREGILQG